jgi:outer membrane protein
MTTGNRLRWRTGALAGLVLAGTLSAFGGGGLPKPFFARPPAIPAAPAAPEQPWVPPPQTQSTALASAPAPEQPPGGRWDLAALVDYALRHNPLTRQSWAQARSAAAAVGVQEGEYYPYIELDGSTSLSRGSVVAGGGGRHQFALGGAVMLSYLLFDGGGRDALTEEARQTALATNFNHNSVLQGVIFRVQSAFYLFQESQALVRAEEAARKEAQSALDAADERHQAGVATIADVLQARARLSQAELALQTILGQVEVARGTLATSAGLAADFPLEVVEPSKEPPQPKAMAPVAQLMSEALARRPELAALEAQSRRAEARIEVARSAARPTLSATGAYGGVYNSIHNNFTNNYALGLTLTFPLFTGHATTYDRLRAQADAEAAREAQNILAQQIGLDVWTSYHNLQTADQRLRTTADLLDSATQSYDVSLGRYKAGVGNIIDLLAAQSTLEQARSERIQAWADWFLAAARLAYATGALNTSPTPAPQGGDTK